MKFIKYLFIALVCVFVLPDSIGQDASANFVLPDIKITTTPQYPGICNLTIGIEVEVNETFMSYLWISPSGNRGGNLKKATLKEIGEWTIRVSYENNGVVCFKDKNLFVADLNDPIQIQQYFVNAGFYAVDIDRNPPSNTLPSTECMPENISFRQGQKESLRPIIQGVLDNFKPLSSLSGGNIVISENNCLCSQGAANLEAQFNNGSLNVWAHQFFSTTSTLTGKLFIKGRMPFDDALPIPEQKSHLTSIHGQILSANGGTSEQGRVIFSNLFMPHPIGGYDLMKECDDPIECYAQGNYLTPAGIPIKLPDGGIDYIFAPSSLPDNVFEGALLGFTDNTSKIMRSFRFQGTKFAGYFHEMSATIAEGFESDPINSYPTQMDAFLPIICEGECKILSIEYSMLNNLPDTYGGLNLELKQDVAGDQLFGGCIELGRRNRGSILGNEYATFMTPTAGLISLDIKKINKIRFVYQEYETNNVEEVASGMLWKFELHQNSETGCVIKKYSYNTESFSYINEDQEVYEDKSKEEDVLNFNYVMNCNGTYSLRNLEKGDRKKHVNSGPNYHEAFTALTTDINFVPFSGNFPGTFEDGAFSIGSKINCSYCPSVETSKQIVRPKYCEEPEHIFVEKIAQLATVYNAYFVEPENGNTYCGYAFTQKKNWEDPQSIYIENPTGNSGVTVPGNLWPWNIYLTNNPGIKAKLTSDKVDFFKTMIAQIAETKNIQMQWWNGISQKTVDEIVCHLRKEPQAITTSIPWMGKKRIALDIVNTGLIYQDKEDAIIHVLASSHATEVLPYIQEKGVAYYFDKFNDAGGDDNLTRIMTMISAKINEKTTNKVVNLQILHDNPSDVPRLEADLWSWSNLNFEISGNIVEINDWQYDYDEILPIEIDGTFTVAGTTYTKGLQVNMPAIQAALLAHDNGKKVSERVGWIAIDIGTLALGVGGAKILLTAGNYLRKAAIAGDLIGSTAGLAVNVLDNDAITPELRSQIQIVAFALSLPQIGIFIVDAVTTARNLRTIHPNDYDAVQEGLALRREAARRDLEGFDEAWEFVRTHPKGEDAWEFITLTINNKSGTLFARDLKTLEKVAEMMTDGSVFRNKFPSSWQDELKDIIDKNRDLRCGACGNNGITRIPPMDEMLENVNYILQYSDKTGFNTIMTNLKSNINNRDGVNHMIIYMKNNPNEFSNVSAFEFRYNDDLLNTADVLVGNTKYEFKSWTPDTPNPWNSFFSGSGNSYTQFTRYLENSNTLSELKYIFNGTKASETVVKSAFKDLFVDKASDLFKPVSQGGIGIDKMKQLFEFEIYQFENAAEFIGLLNNNQVFRNNALKFIKAE